MLPTITQDVLDLPPGTQVQFPGTLEDYEQLLERLSDRPAIRVRFRNNQVILMAPLPEHGKNADSIANFVKALLQHQGIDWEGFTPITLRQFGMAGLEPDACFYIQNRQAILGKQRLDLSIDPPPDLAIETDLTSFADINDYLSLAVPEVWIYKTNRIQIYQFAGDRYREVETSPLFPTIPVSEILPKYVQRAWEQGSSVALREFERFLQSEFPASGLT